MATFLKDDQNVLVRDQNRYRKIYRYMRKKPRPLNCEGSNISNFVWGSYFVEFKDQAEVEHHFPCCYENPPAVIATTVSKTITGSVWQDAGGAGSATVAIRCFGAGSTSKNANVHNEFIHLKNADGTLDAITFGGTVYSTAATEHANRTITRVLNINVSSASTWGAFVSTVVAAINADPDIQWSATDNGDTGAGSKAKFTLTSKTGNKGPRPSAIANPSTGNNVYDSWSLAQSRIGGTAAELFQSSVGDGSGSAGSFVSGNISSNPNFNVFITDIAKNKCTFRTSGYFTGYVYYQALVDGAYTMPNIGKSLEVKTLTFDGSNDYVTYNFTASFTCEPIVTVTADEDVNAFVTALSSNSVTVEVSKSGYTGKVYLQAIEKGC